MKKNIRKRGFMMRSEDERKLSNNLFIKFLNIEAHLPM